MQFLSTSSARRTTFIARWLSKEQDISIHVLREEDDFILLWTPPRRINFYPRPPRGGRPSDFKKWCDV